MNTNNSISNSLKKLLELNTNSLNAKNLLKNIINNIAKIDWEWNDPAYSALDYALITPKEARPEEAKNKLQNILKRFS